MLPYETKFLKYFRFKSTLFGYCFLSSFHIMSFTNIPPMDFRF